ncbi:zinc-binding dehydrogenase [Tropicimonas sp. IMCC34011]|uniref:zinc-binding dehydrogenase n=1 Tax=Tropicimonas sp. IMCC34011 TaxID=2248759 RepID=UPI001E5391B5|nr:zinc-binding dehydrogenase [Tropicimonas sp. IMCC34011]
MDIALGILGGDAVNEHLACMAPGGRHIGLPLLGAGRVRPVMSDPFVLTEAAAAHELLESRTNVGKIVLTFEEDTTR